MNQTVFKQFIFPGMIFLVALFQSKISAAQNICPNYSFENINPCPAQLSELVNALPWTDAPGSTSTSDLFNACHTNSNPVICQDVGVPDNFGGSAFARTGNGYAGIICYYGSTLREYLSVQLDSIMDPGVAYHVEFYVRRAALCTYAIDKIGLLISSGPIVQNGSNNIPVVPQIESKSLISDANSWTLIDGIYLAVGGEDHITIGNFRDNAGTVVANLGAQATSCVINNLSAYYYIDDVKIERINEKVVIVGDTLICDGMSTTLTANTNVNTWWSTGSQPLDTFSYASTITVTPAVTTTYILNGIFIKDSATVYVVSPPVVNLGPDTSVCDGISLNLNASNSNAAYMWSTGDTGAFVLADQDQLYWVLVDNGGCVSGDSINLTVLSNPPVIFGNDSVFCLNDPEPLLLDAGEGSAYFWQPFGDTSRIITATQELTYKVTVNHLNGCTTSAEITTLEACPATVFVPGAFTPNGDGRNEMFQPGLANVLSYELRIFNRWGNLLFMTENVNEGWNGKFKNSPVPSGNYIYVIKYQSLTDSQRIDKKTIRGSVLLIN